MLFSLSMVLKQNSSMYKVYLLDLTTGDGYVATLVLMITSFPTVYAGLGREMYKGQTVLLRKVIYKQLII